MANISSGAGAWPPIRKTAQRELLVMWSVTIGGMVRSRGYGQYLESSRWRSGRRRRPWLRTADLNVVGWAALLGLCLLAAVAGVVVSAALGLPRLGGAVCAAVPLIGVVIVDRRRWARMETSFGWGGSLADVVQIAAELEVRGINARVVTAETAQEWGERAHPGTRGRMSRRRRSATATGTPMPWRMCCGARGSVPQIRVDSHRGHDESGLRPKRPDLVADYADSPSTGRSIEALSESGGVRGRAGSRTPAGPGGGGRRRRKPVSASMARNLMSSWSWAAKARTSASVRFSLSGHGVVDICPMYGGIRAFHAIRPRRCGTARSCRMLRKPGPGLARWPAQRWRSSLARMRRVAWSIAPIT